MNHDKFWNLIENNLRQSHDAYERLNHLKATLSGLSLEEIISFEITYRHYLNKAYTWDLWGAAYIIHNGCSNDLFEYFRRWLVSRGRETYEAALNDPDSLAQLELHPSGPDGNWEFEEIYYAAGDVFEAKGGKGDVRDYSELEAGLDGLDPDGEAFNTNKNYLSKRYPKLWERFGRKFWFSFPF